MARKRLAQLKYSDHISGQTRVMLENRTIYLGEYDSPESKAKDYAIPSIYMQHGNRLPEDYDQRQDGIPITVRCINAEFRQRELPRYSGNEGYHCQRKNLCTLLKDHHDKEAR